MFIDLSIKKINEIKNKNVNDLKITLANEATSMLHGKSAAETAEQTARKTFVSGSIGEDLPTLKVSKKEISKEEAEKLLKEENEKHLADHKHHHHEHKHDITNEEVQEKTKKSSSSKKLPALKKAKTVVKKTKKVKKVSKK